MIREIEEETVHMSVRFTIENYKFDTKTKLFPVA